MDRSTWDSVAVESMTGEWIDVDERAPARATRPLESRVE